MVSSGHIGAGAGVAVLRRGDHRSVQALEADIRDWIKAWNTNPKPFIWIKTAEQSSAHSVDFYN